MAGEPVVSIADRLKQRRDELGISQAQAARELDVARTAYRLWEMEAAKPAPDRWRLIASWLGVSVTTMLLAEELVTEDEATMSEATAVDFGRSGSDWDEAGAANEGDFFYQARELIAQGTGGGHITVEQADAFALLIDRIEQESAKAKSEGWVANELRKSLEVSKWAPREAREALVFVAEGVPEELLQVAQVLTSELVSNSVRHGPPGPYANIGLFITVDRNRLRVEVADGSSTGARPTAPGEDGGFGLPLIAEMSSRWGAGREGGRNLTWFEIDLPQPGFRPPLLAGA